MNSDRILCNRQSSKRDEGDRGERARLSGWSDWTKIGDTCDIVSVDEQRDSEFGISTANLRRAHGGCLGVERKKGVEVCEMPGGADKQAMIPGYPTATS